MHEKKFQLELEKRENIINKIREERNKIFVQYQELNTDFVTLFKLTEQIISKEFSEEINEKINILKKKYKASF